MVVAVKYCFNYVLSEFDNINEAINYVILNLVIKSNELSQKTIDCKHVVYDIACS